MESEVQSQHQQMLPCRQFRSVCGVSGSACMSSKAVSISCLSVGSSTLSDSSLERPSVPELSWITPSGYHAGNSENDHEREDRICMRPNLSKRCIQKSAAGYFLRTRNLGLWRSARCLAIALLFHLQIPELPFVRTHVNTTKYYIIHKNKAIMMKGG